MPSAGNYEDPGNCLDSDSYWDGMEEDFYSLRNTYKVDVNDAGVALSGISECCSPSCSCHVSVLFTYCQYCSLLSFTRHLCLLSAFHLISVNNKS